jgi:hypothetical protein
MRINKSYWLAACGTLAVAGAVMLFSAHRIEAQYSTPVKVLNTSAGPVLNSRIDDPGRVPYLASINPNCSAGFLCDFNFPTVQAGRRVVIQQVSALLSFGSNPTGVFGSVITPGAQIDFNSPPTSNGTVAQFGQPLLCYFDAGQSPTVRLYSGGGSAAAPFSGAQLLTLAGYELDCNAAPCAAISNH